MADDFLKVTLTGDASGFEKAAQQVEKKSAQVEASMEAAAATAAATSTKMGASLQGAADKATAAADQTSKRFSSLFDGAELPSQKAAAAVSTVAKAAEQTGAALATNQKQQGTWGEAVAAAATRVRDATAAAFGVAQKAAQTTGQAFSVAASAVQTAANAIGAALRNTAAESDKTASAHGRSGASIRLAWGSAAAAVAAAVAAMRSALSDAKELQNLSEVTGVGIDSLQRLKFAAEQSGATFKDVQAAVKSWGETVNEIATNPTAKANQALGQMGISLRDSFGATKDFTTILGQVADKFATYTNSADKAALAQAIFKGSGDALIPLLNKGSAGIRELGAEAERLGLILDAQTAKKLDDANKETAKFAASMTRLGAELAINVLPFLTKVAEAISFIVASIRKSTPIDDAKDKVAKLNEELQFLLNIPKVDFEGQIGEPAEKAIGRARAELAKAKAELKALEDLADGKPLEVDIKNQKRPENKAPSLNPLTEMKADLDDFLNRLHGLPVLMGEAFAFDAKPFEDAVKKVNAAVASNVISEREANRIKLDLKRQEQAAILDTASVAASTITTVFANNKAAAIGAAVINTAVAVTKALSGSVPPWNFIQAGLVAAAGAAQIASIASASQSGGGSVAPVSGGSASAAPAAPTAVEERVLRVQGFSRKEFMDGDTIADIAQGLLDFQKDGGRVVIDRKA